MVLGTKTSISTTKNRAGFPDSDTSTHIEATVIVDEAGAQIGIVGNPIVVDSQELSDMEGKGDIAVGTSEVEIAFTGTPTQVIRVQADPDNTGIVFIGKTGVLSDKTNDVFRLNPEDEALIPYNDAINAWYAISDTAAQTINAGAFL